MSATDSYSQVVYEYIAQIPAGKVTTYGQIAKELLLPTPRLVGRILHLNPDSTKYPCHRVVFSDGSLAPSYAFGGAEAQRAKLENEGVIFNKNKVNLKMSLL